MTLVAKSLPPGWASRLRQLTDRVGHVFARPEPRVVFHDLVEGLLSDLPKKNCWSLSERAGHSHPGRMQALLSRGAWSADALEAEVRSYVIEHLGDPDAMLVIRDAQVIKRGDKSVGVGPQHCTLTNRIENCQVAVMLAYAAPAGTAYVGHRLHLPRTWIADSVRRRKAGIPADVAYASRPEQAVELLAEAVDAAVPFSWVSLDDGYAQHPQVRDWCVQRALPYIAAVPATLPLIRVGATRSSTTTGPEQILGHIADSYWHRRTERATGRTHDWALVGLGGSLLVGGEVPTRGFAQSLMVRRSVDNPHDVAYFVAHARRRTPASVLIGAAERRHRAGQPEQPGDELIGLDQYQVRTWTAWHHTITTCMLAHAFRTVQHTTAPDARTAVRKPRQVAACRPGVGTGAASHPLRSGSGH
ncbi:MULTISPECIES: IS701 family transposase [unclassified Micromonospora]|uniref:IS701 family transposase n=1 Tax=unclassified Micromonospora TaxID=2617518 RepID=UPI001C604699|nr:IS701 family transposase [Micromonospora sp. RL09-050-HVF-A]MBW4702001.1 IS701 family transposase [Micromonospora sp. RL09-050-HVF-A]